jgi:hypothetical protein
MWILGGSFQKVVNGCTTLRGQLASASADSQSTTRKALQPGAEHPQPSRHENIQYSYTMGKPVSGAYSHHLRQPRESNEFSYVLPGNPGTRLDVFSFFFLSFLFPFFYPDSAGLLTCCGPPPIIPPNMPPPPASCCMIWTAAWTMVLLSPAKRALSEVRIVATLTRCPSFSLRIWEKKTILCTDSREHIY